MSKDNAKQIYDFFVNNMNMSHTGASAFLGNLMQESNLQPGLNEINPTVPGSRGGYGIAQWTGPRRNNFENFAKTNSSPFNDLNTQLNFLQHELNLPENSNLLRNLQSSALTTEGATRAIQDSFLRPGIPHTDKRINYANKFANQLSRSPNTMANTRSNLRNTQWNSNAFAKFLEEPINLDMGGTGTAWDRYRTESFGAVPKTPSPTSGTAPGPTAKSWWSSLWDGNTLTDAGTYTGGINDWQWFDTPEKTGLLSTLGTIGNAGASIWNAFNAGQQQNMLEDYYKNQWAMANRNLANQAQLINNRLEDQFLARAGGANREVTEADVQSYMKRRGVDGSPI